MKFTIVTPSYNKARFLTRTIESVITQEGDFSIEYLVVDNCSCDGSVEILAGFEKRFAAGEFQLNCRGVSFRWISEQDSGMYDAVNKGFAMATGAIHAYLNADDVYLPGALDAVARTFKLYDQIRWLKGITSYIDEEGTLIEEGLCYLYHRPWIREGIYGREAYFIQQDSVFWRECLWRQAGGIDTRYKRAGDYYLWRAFAAHEPLYSLKLPVSCFRRSKGQLSEDWASYRKECAEMVPESGSFFRRLIRMYFAQHQKIPKALRSQVYWFLFGTQDLNLVELRPSGVPQLKRVGDYVA